MNLAVLLPLIMPLISQFLKGKSGDDINNLLTGNQDQLSSILSGLAGGGGSSLPIPGGGDTGVLSALTLLLPLLMKQNSVVVMGPSPANNNVLVPAQQSEDSGLPPPVELTKTIQTIEKRLGLIEKNLKIEWKG